MENSRIQAILEGRDLPLGLSQFVGRKEALQKITRFDNRNVMYYRDNDYLHSLRVYGLVNDIAATAIKTYGEQFEIELCRAIALTHDDAEIICGDTQSNVKDEMTQQQKEQLKQAEKEAIKTLAKRWPFKIGNFEYEYILERAIEKDCPEAQAVSYLDKIDAFCATIHEVLAGNHRFLTVLDFYTRKIKNFAKDFPALSPLLQQNHPLLFTTTNIKTEKRIHNKESLKRPVGIDFYDRWIQVSAEQIGAENLTTIKESEQS